MNKKRRDSYKFDLFPDSSEDFGENDNSPWNYLAANKNIDTYEENKTEILWSREKKYFFSEDEFFNNGSFSDLSGRSTSSCSWHNDEFDMKSSAKVSKSLEAVEDALFEKKNSSFISEEVFKECCDWASKFPFLRLKGEQVTKPIDKNEFDSINEFEICDTPTSLRNSSIDLKVEGKKIALCAAEKSSKKANFEFFNQLEPPDTLEEIIASHDDCIENLDITDRENQMTEAASSKKVEDVTDMETTISSLQDKIVEKLAQHFWPKVLEKLQKCHEDKNLDKTEEDFQLPPIVTMQNQHRLAISNQRPKTEGNNFSLNDFPKLDSFLTVSPKILQDRKDCRSGKSSTRSSRPSSEIHLFRRNNASSFLSNRSVAHNASALVKTPSSSKMQSFPQKSVKKYEDDHDKTSLYLPALEEDINDPADYLKELPILSESKHITTSVISHFPKKPECFLPPIDTDNMHSDVKLTRNLFTFFGSDLKCPSKVEHLQKSRIASRPNTCASKKETKLFDNVNYKFLNDSFKSSSQTINKRNNDNSDTQVTLFPIVTALVPSREKSCSSAKKSLLSSFGGQKR